LIRSLHRLRLLAPILRPFLAQRLRVGFGVLATVAAATLLLSLPWLAGRALDAARLRDTARVTWLAAGFAAAAFAESALRYAARRLLVCASRRAEELLKGELIAKLTRMPLAALSFGRTGDLISRLTQDVELLRFVTGPLLLYGVQALVVVPGGIVLLAQSSLPIALGGAALLGVMVMTLRRLAGPIERKTAATQAALAAIATHAAERAVGIRVVAAFDLARDEDRSMERLAGTLAERGVAQARWNAAVNVVIHLAVELVILLGLWLGAIEVLEGRSTPGALLEFWAMLAIQLGPLMALGFVFSGFPRALAAGERLASIHGATPEADGGIPLTDGPLRIEVRDLRITVPSRDEPALDGLTFTLQPGRTLGIVGAVGSGKSTLLDVLLRFLDPPRGSVLVSGLDILDVRLADLRARFAVALQDPFLFSDSIADNIRFGAGDGDVDAAVRLADLTHDLEQMPDGANTVVGERGVTLSGGQRQRAALARAMLTDREVLVLDDTLSAVDHATESRILANLRRRSSGRTTILVSHRLSAVRHADSILVLERGRTLDHGTHDELIERCESYRRSWLAQQEQRALEPENPPAEGA
jgi:ATP-binding cassette subfamily B protein/ATP-binding cassette subfamily C protein/ATP-binding cassette subfamily B multidrug efflux pump